MALLVNSMINGHFRKLILETFENTRFRPVLKSTTS